MGDDIKGFSFNIHAKVGSQALARSTAPPEYQGPNPNTANQGERPSENAYWRIAQGDFAQDLADAWRVLALREDNRTPDERRHLRDVLGALSELEVQHRLWVEVYPMVEAVWRVQTGVTLAHGIRALEGSQLGRCLRQGKVWGRIVQRALESGNPGRGVL